MNDLMTNENTVVELSTQPNVKRVWCGSARAIRVLLCVSSLTLTQACAVRTATSVAGGVASTALKTTGAAVDVLTFAPAPEMSPFDLSLFAVPQPRGFVQ